MKLSIDKAIECIRDYCEKHTLSCKNCKFNENFELCMFERCPCDWKTEKEKKNEQM